MQFEIFTIFSLCHELSPTCMLKSPGRNPVQITCNTSSTYHIQHVLCHMVWRNSWAISFDWVKITFILALFYWLKPFTDFTLFTGYLVEQTWKFTSRYTFICQQELLRDLSRPRDAVLCNAYSPCRWTEFELSLSSHLGEWVIIFKRHAWCVWLLFFIFISLSSLSIFSSATTYAYLFMYFFFNVCLLFLNLLRGKRGNCQAHMLTHMRHPFMLGCSTQVSRLL